MVTNDDKRKALLRRFMAKVNQLPGKDGCWEWTASKFWTGYGRITVDGRSRTAHTVAYELWLGPIPDGLVINHLCENRWCVNIFHLEAVTQSENLRWTPETQAAINSEKKVCDSGHPYTPANTYRRPDGWRGCRACRAEANKRKYQRDNDYVKVSPLTLSAADKQSIKDKVRAGNSQRRVAREFRIAQSDVSRIIHDQV